MEYVDVLPAVFLKQLVQSGQSEDAIAHCRQQLVRQPDSRFYAYWLERLADDDQDPVEATPLLPGMVTPARAQVGPLLKQRMLAEFAAAPYKIQPAPEPSGDLDKARAKIIATIPFRSEIYLPTSKIPMEDQVAGLSRVRSLVQSANLTASRQRFDTLKATLQSLGKNRIFVIGNGPSLKRTDLSLLKDEITIGFNGIFLHDSFTPTIYMVEDHLVAEDRKSEIHAYDCFVKVFPSYLGYCIEPQENTLFLNHRPRISFPVDTDFSADAGNITYTGGTVTYTGLQLAASLGFKEIILIGVDASYQVHDVERSDSYGTGVLTSKSDDANHFDPRYFGKGYRWHDPNVNTMLQAYRKVHNYGRANGVSVVNATLGGQLEVFPRVDFHDLFPPERVFPRLAVLDFTSVNQLCATGIVKQNLLAGWPKGAQMHTSAPNEGRLVSFQTVAHDLYAKDADLGNVWASFRSLVEFDPEVLYMRPTLDRVVMTSLQVVAASILGRPWTIHYMDDWLEKASAVRTPAVAQAYETIMRSLLTGAARVYSICQKMSDFLVRKYALSPDRVVVAHNYMLDTAASGKPAHRADGQPLVIRYLGGLEPDMGLASLVDLARKIEACNAEPGATPIRLEIHAGEIARKRHGNQFDGFPSTILLPQFSAYPDYLNALATSDLNLICYNFDAKSVDYVRYSLANKLPELLGAGLPFLIIGHPDIATVQLLKEADYPLVADSPDYDVRAIQNFVLAPQTTSLERYHAAISVLKDEFSDARNRVSFQRALREAAALPPGGLRGASVPLTELALLRDAARASLAATRDLDCLLCLPLVDRAILDQTLALVRSHGLAWSIRKEFDLLQVECPDAAALSRKDDATKARALAFLICSLGGETHNHPVVNSVVREWLLANHPLPAVRH